MVTVRDIKQIETGPRQLTLGFEDSSGQPETRILSAIRELSQAQGRVFLDHLIARMTQADDLTDREALQGVFWCAEDLTLYFRIHGTRVLPREVRKMLLAFPDTRVELVLNQPVADPIFKGLVDFYQHLTEQPPRDIPTDQYDFALSLLSDLNDWQETLKSFEPLARKPFYPGRQTIQEHRRFLKQLLTHRDSYSLITRCFEYKEGIAGLVRNIQTLSQFYTQHALFWESLIRAREAFQDTLSELRQHPDTAFALDRLEQILTDPSPWDMLAEAEHVMKTLQARHDRIEQVKIQTRRQEATAAITALIEKVTRHLNRGHAAPDLRNQYLYPLRNAAKQIEKKPTIPEIDRLVSAAEDMADDALIC